MQILIGIGSALCIAIVNVFLKKLFEKVSSREVAPLSFLLAFLTMLVFSPLYFHFNYSLKTLIILLIVFTIDTIANYLYFRAIESCEVTYSSVFMSLSPIFTLLIFTIFIDRISFRSLIAAVGIVFSVYILNLNHKGSLLEPFVNIFRNKHYMGLLYAVFAGGSAVFIKLLFNEGTINPPTLYLLRCLVIFLMISAVLRPRLNKIDLHTVILTWYRVIFVIGNFLLYLYAISLGNVVVATTVSSIYPAFILAFSYFMFKEKITIEKGFAILSIIIFVATLNYSF